MLSLYMFHRIIFLLLIVSSLFCNFHRCCAVCFQSLMNKACRSSQNAARIKRFSRLHIVRESSFNMTGEGDEDIETRSLNFLGAPSLVVEKISEPPLLLLQFLCSPEERSLDCIKYIYRYCLQWFIL